jgi:DNA-binding NarL/FixJ family response regulator
VWLAEGHCAGPVEAPGLVVGRALPTPRIGRPEVSMTEVCLVDEQPLLRAGLHKLLDSTDDLRLLGDVGTGRASIEQIAASRPEVELLEMCLAGTDGVEAVRQLTLLDGPPAVVVLPSV